MKRHFGQGNHLLVSLLMAGAFTASLITFASGPANTLAVYAQYEGPGIGNYEHPVPGAVITVSPACDQASVVTDANGLAFFTGCSLDSPDLTTKVVSYPDTFRPLECPAEEPLCQPSHSAATLADHRGDDIFVFKRLETPPEPSPTEPPRDYGYTYPSPTPPVVGGTLRGNRPATSVPANMPSPVPDSVTASATPSPVTTAQTSGPGATPSATPDPDAERVAVVASSGGQTTAGVVAIVLLMILAGIFLGRAALHHMRR